MYMGQVTPWGPFLGRFFFYKKFNRKTFFLSICLPTESVIKTPNLVYQWAVSVCHIWGQDFALQQLAFWMIMVCYIVLLFWLVILLPRLASCVPDAYKFSRMLNTKFTACAHPWGATKWLIKNSLWRMPCLVCNLKCLEHYHHSKE